MMMNLTSSRAHRPHGTGCRWRPAPPRAASRQTRVPAWCAPPSPCGAGRRWRAGCRPPRPRWASWGASGRFRGSWRIWGPGCAPEAVKETRMVSHIYIYIITPLALSIYIRIAPLSIITPLSPYTNTTCTLPRKLTHLRPGLRARSCGMETRVVSYSSLW